MPPKKKKKQSPLLYVLLAIMAIGIVALLIDRSARQAANNADSQLNRAAQEGRKSPDDVHTMLGREPDEPIAEQTGRLIEKYTWGGALQSYYVQVVYNPGDPPILSGVYLNEEP